VTQRTARFSLPGGGTRDGRLLDVLSKGAAQNFENPYIGLSSRALAGKIPPGMLFKPAFRAENLRAGRFIPDAADAELT
jgi:hypothetical protein